ncbi:MAG: helix-turn-helix transcriptional regulator, partial [Myxococcales bacterium]|nr:helix-turn-helix transcriptional regulator [Myxococcales bacterium]
MRAIARVRTRVPLGGPVGSAIALDPRKSPRQQRSEQTVAVLLQATARVLVDTGWDRASTNRIARAAGVSVGSLYQYFPNKESLVLALARQHAEEVVAMLAAHVG